MVDCCFPLAEFIWAELAKCFAALLVNFAEIVERVLDRMREAEGQHFPFSYITTAALTHRIVWVGKEL